MAVCYNCKTEFNGKFCPTCGAVAQAGPAPAPVQVAPRVAPPPVYTNVSVTPASQPTSVLGWIGWMMLIGILPVIGIIIMALASTDPSAKNFAKANLLLMLIALIIALIAVGAMLLLGIGLGAASSI